MSTLHVGNEGVGTDGVNDKVGIGTTNPPVKLTVDVGNNVQIASFISSHATNSEVFIGKELSNNNSLVAGFNCTSNIGYLQIHGDNTGTGLVIKRYGNVGIGTSNPQYKLDVNSSEIRISNGSNRTIIRVMDEAGAEKRLGWNSGLNKWEAC